MIEMIRMNRILESDVPNLRARIVQPGMFNLEFGNALAPFGYQYLPDPASQKAATLGGNVAENSGGPHCFKYGVTTKNHVLGLHRGPCRDNRDRPPGRQGTGQPRLRPHRSLGGEPRHARDLLPSLWRASSACPRA